MLAQAVLDTLFFYSLVFMMSYLGDIPKYGHFRDIAQLFPQIHVVFVIIRRQERIHIYQRKHTPKR